MMQLSQPMTKYSLVRHQKKRNIQTISTPNIHSHSIAFTSSSKLNSNTPTILPPVGKKYMCFMKEGKSDQADRCIKSRIMTKVIDYVLSIDTFEKTMCRAKWYVSITVTKISHLPLLN